MNDTRITDAACNVSFEPTNAEELLAWLGLLAEYGGPMRPDGRELAEPHLWMSGAQIALCDPRCDDPNAFAGELMEHDLTTARNLRALLRMVAATAARDALMYALGRTGPAGAGELMDFVAGVPWWGRHDRPEHAPARYPLAWPPDSSSFTTAALELLADGLATDAAPAGTAGWRLYPWLAALLRVDARWAVDPHLLVAACSAAAEAGLGPLAASAWCRAGGLAPASGWTGFEPWHDWAATGWQPPAGTSCADWQRWRDAGYDPLDAEELAGLPPEHPRRPSDEALSVIAALRPSSRA